MIIKARLRQKIIPVNKPKLASDLSGVTYIDAYNGEYRMKEDLKDWLGSLKKM